MKLWETEHTFEHPWHTITLAHWNKYPNPYAQHVISVDIINREIRDGKLYTERLLQCRQPAPSIFRRIGFGFPETTWFVEYSVTDPKTRDYKAVTHNLSMREYFCCQETLTYSTVSTHRTMYSVNAKVTAVGFSALGSLVEHAAVNRFKANALKGRQGLEAAIDSLKNLSHQVFN
jgi:hypothetical protein